MNTTTQTGSTKMSKSFDAEVVFDVDPGKAAVHGVTFDGERVWFVHGDQGAVCAFDPATGSCVRDVPVEGADAGAAYDGKHLWIVAGDKIVKVDPVSGEVLHSIPAPDGVNTSGLTYHDGALWVGGYKKQTIKKIDPQTGRVQKTLKSDRFVTGITWSEGELWHGTRDPGNEVSDLRRIDPESGEVLASVAMPEGAGVSGIEAGAPGVIWCGDGWNKRLRAVKLPAAARAKRTS